MTHTPASFNIKTSYSATFSHAGHYVAVLGRDVRLWDVATQACLLTIRPFPHPSAVRFSPDDSALLIKNSSGTLALCDRTTGTIRCIYKRKGEGEDCAPHFSPDGTAIMDGSPNGSITIHDALTLDPTAQRTFDGCMIDHIAGAPQASLCAFAVIAKAGHPMYKIGDTVIMRYRWHEALRDLRPLASPGDLITAMVFNPSGTRLAVIRRYGHIRVYAQF
jgi:WD40 repeat protein